jgi:hypothetical protein
MTGDLTLGTDKITLDATDGNITAAGNVGIGTDPTGKKLVVQTKTQYDGINITNGTSLVAELVGLEADNDDGALALYENGTKGVQINAGNGNNFFKNGNIGIGTNTPQAKLHVDGTILSKTINYNSNQDQPYLIAGATTYTGATTEWNTYGIQHRFKSNSSGTARVTIDTVNGEAFCVTNPGNVGIGTGEPRAKLDVISGSNPFIAYPSGTWASRIFNQNDSAGSNGLVVANRYVSEGSSVFQAGSLFPDTDSAGGNFREFFRITGNGNVGIGTDDPRTMLDVDGSASFAGNVQTFGNPLSGAASGCLMREGTLNLSAVNSIDNTKPANAFVIYETGISVPKIALTNRGRLSLGVTAVDSNSSPSAQGIDLNGVDGSASFYGGVYAQKTSTGTGEGTIAAQQLSSGNCFEAKNNSGAVVWQVNSSGSSTFSGDVTAKNVSFNLEADDDTKYTSTTDSEGNETRVYNGAVLDVKDRLQKSDAALKALKVAAAAASNFDALKSAIATALADI